MKKKPSNSTNNQITPPPDSIPSNIPIFSSPTTSPPSAPLSDHQTPRKRDSRPPSFSTSNSSISTSPYESPFHTIPSSSSIPFSWERHPGIPKTPEFSAASETNKETKFLPPPPPVRSGFGNCRRKRSDGGEHDPFFAALTRCVKEGSPVSETDGSAGGWRRFAGKSVGVWDRTGLMSLYGSCKTACSVSDVIIVVNRPSRRIDG